MNELKYFEEGDVSRGQDGNGILLGENVFSVCFADGKVKIVEECDGFYFEEYPPEQAIELFQEAIDWIKRGMLTSNHA